MRKNVSSQGKKDRCAARILIELRNEQPLTKDEILGRTGMSRSAFYDGIRFLKDVNLSEIKISSEEFTGDDGKKIRISTIEIVLGKE